MNFTYWLKRHNLMGVNKYNRLGLPLILIILTMSFAVRIYLIDKFPLLHDESRWILNALHHPDIFWGIPVAYCNGYIQPVYLHLVFLTKHIFASPEYAVRFPAVLIGIGTVVLIYKLGRDMYNENVGLLSATLLAFLPWHIVQSRVGVTVILTPFWGCFLLFILLLSINRQSRVWFLIFCLLWGVGSFYTYQASLLFIPIFFAAVFCIKKQLLWLNLKTKLIGTSIFLFTLLPLIYLVFIGQAYYYLYKITGMFMGQRQFNGFFGPFQQIFSNLLSNAYCAYRFLFIDSSGALITAERFEEPLLIHRLSSPLILCSVIFAMWKNRVPDKILLLWLLLGLIGGLGGVSFHQARYIFIILPPLIILVSRLIVELLSAISKRIDAIHKIA